MQYMIPNTIKPGNTKEKAHDFPIISHVEQALSAREAAQQAADAAQKGAARVKAEEEERLESEIEEIRSQMTEADLTDLREQAEREIARTE